MFAIAVEVAMSLELEKIERAAGQDRDDLITIYERADHDARRLPEMPDISEDATRFVRCVFERPGYRFYAARFNGRLIAAAVVLTTEDSCQIDAICVRESSRGRGVAARFINRLLPVLAADCDEIVVALPQSGEYLREMVELADFDHEHDRYGHVTFRRKHANRET